MQKNKKYEFYPKIVFMGFVILCINSYYFPKQH
jgi:hypothetical protein